MSPLFRTLLREHALPASWVAALLAFTLGPQIPPPVLALLLFAVIIWAAFAVLRHAEAVGHRLGEPFGTLVLTLAVTCIEVSIITAVMFSGEAGAGFARDTMFAVVMIVMNGLLGLALLVGGLRHREQALQLQSAQSYLGVIVPLAVGTLVLPNFTRSMPDASLSLLQSIFLAGMALVLYGVFLSIQTSSHREIFEELAETPPSEGDTLRYALGVHVGLLVAYLVPIVLLAENLGHSLAPTINDAGLPVALGGTLVAVMVLAPEGLSALNAARRNRLQRSVNLLLGSVLASIGLTVPTVIGIAFFTGRHLTLGVTPANMVLLTLTLASSVLTFFSGRTNVLQGAIHLALFVGYFVLMFD